MRPIKLDVNVGKYYMHKGVLGQLRIETAVPCLLLPLLG